MALIRSKGGVVLNRYLVARVFAFDDHESEARAACVAKGWDDVRRGPPWLVPTIKDGAITRTPQKLAASPDHSMLAVSYGGSPYVYDLRTGEPRPRLFSKGHCSGLAFSPDSRALAVVTGVWNSGYITIHELTTGHLRCSKHCSTEPSAALFSSTLLLVGFSDGRVNGYDPSNGKPRNQIVARRTESGAAVLAMSLSRDGLMLAVSCSRWGQTGTFTLYDMATGEVRWESVDNCASAVFSGDGSIVAANYLEPFNTAVNFYDTATGVPRSFSVDRFGNIDSVEFSVDSLVLAVGGPRAAIYSITKHEVVRRALDLHGLWGGVRACEFSPDRGKLAVIGNNTSVAFYDVATGARKLRPKQARRSTLPDQFAALSLSFQIGGRRKRASAKFSPRATSRAAVVTPDEKENAPAPFSAEVSAAPFSAQPSGASDSGECKQS